MFYKSPGVRFLICGLAGMLFLATLSAKASAAVTSIVLQSQNMSLDAASGTTVGGDKVFNLTDLSITSGTLTLTGSATDRVVINVSDSLMLSSGRIVLGGKLKASNVFINYTGTDPSKALRIVGTSIVRATVALPGNRVLVSSRAIKVYKLTALKALSTDAAPGFPVYSKS